MATLIDGWVVDERGNRCSLARWGTEEKARAVLATCSRCSRCSDCSDCSDCSRCSDCSGCSDCSRCSRCSGCSDCSGCSRCSGCSYCSDCSDCSRCSGCSDCSGCSGCSDCSRCSRCSGYAPAKAPMKIPVIENINQRVLEAASKPGAFEMNNFHTCETTHCRAGWAVHLAGKDGYALERATSSVFAAMQIYKASGSPISPVRFFESNEVAMADMKKCAEEEMRRQS
jgi:hypothetical protein